MRPTKPYFIALLAFVALGVLFAGTSTYDFVAHLDRQVHSITCSFIPGLGADDVSGTSGCAVVMMSPYSSLFRSLTWGGLPISLLALAVFAYLLFASADLFVRGEDHDPDQVRYLVAATGLPLAMSVIYFAISSLIIGTVCKLCIGVYISSIGAFVSAVLAFRTARLHSNQEPKPIPWNRYMIYFAEGVVFVIVPVILYLLLKPDYSAATSECGVLNNTEDKYEVMIPLHTVAGGLPAIELLDPLCPACKSFDDRLAASGLKDQLNLQGVLFPLDNECNWMVPSALHPGACEVSEAVLCAQKNPRPVIEWAFMNQEELRTLATKDRKALVERLKGQFPDLASCIGKPSTRTRLNRSLRWVVSNSLPVLTPQLYVNGQKLCDEDTDLGLEYSLTRLLSAQKSGGGTAPQP